MYALHIVRQSLISLVQTILTHYNKDKFSLINENETKITRKLYEYPLIIKYPVWWSFDY